MGHMGPKELWTAAELEKLSPDEREEIIRSGIVSDLTDVPEAFLQRVQANVRDHIASTESATVADR